MFMKSKDTSSRLVLKLLMLLLLLVGGGLTVSAQTSTTVTYSYSDATYGETSGWTNSVTFAKSGSPSLTVSASANNMDQGATTSYLDWRTGSATSSTYTMTLVNEEGASPHRFITGYSVTIQYAGDDGSITFASNGGEAQTVPTDAPKTFEVSGLNTQQSFSFTLAGTNKATKVTEISVTYDTYTPITTLPAKNITATPTFMLATPKGSNVSTTELTYASYNATAGNYLTSSTKTGKTTTPDPTNANLLFAVVHGYTGAYLYNVGGARFVDQIANPTPLLDVPVLKRNVTFDAGTSSDATYFPTYLGVNGQHMHANNVYDYGIVSWNYQNSNNSNWAVLEVGSQDLTAAYQKLWGAEADDIDATLVQAGTLGYPKTTSAGYTNVQSASTQVRAGSYAGSWSDIESLKTAYNAETDVVLPEDGGVYAIAGWVIQNVTVDGATVHDFHLYNNDGKFAVATSASATTLNNLWLAVKANDGTYSFRSLRDGKYLSASAGLADAVYPFTISSGKTHSALSLYNSTLGESGRYAATGYANSKCQFGTTQGSKYYGDSKTQAAWSTDFRFTTYEGYSIYTVNFVGVPAGQSATLTYHDWTGIADGQIFVASATGVLQSDFTAPSFDGYASVVSVDNTNRTVTVTYSADGITITFDGADVSVNGNAASSSFSCNVGTAITSLNTGSNDFVAYTLNGTTYYGKAILPVLSQLTTSATITVTPLTGAISITDVNGDALTPDGQYILYNVGIQNTKYGWVSNNGDANDNYIYPQENYWASNYIYKVEGAGDAIVIKSAYNNNYLTASDFTDGARKVSATATTIGDALLLHAVQGSTENGFALTANSTGYLNYFASGALGFWNNSQATAATNTWQFIPAMRISFVDENGSPIQVNGTLASGSFNARPDVTLKASERNTWTALSHDITANQYIEYTINGAKYYSVDMAGVLAALNALPAENATVTLTIKDLQRIVFVDENAAAVEVTGYVGGGEFTGSSVALRDFEKNTWTGTGVTHAVGDRQYTKFTLNDVDYLSTSSDDMTAFVAALNRLPVGTTTVVVTTMYEDVTDTDGNPLSAEHTYAIKVAGSGQFAFDNADDANKIAYRGSMIDDNARWRIVEQSNHEFILTNVGTGRTLAFFKYATVATTEENGSYTMDLRNKDFLGNYTDGFTITCWNDTHDDRGTLSSATHWSWNATLANGGNVFYFEKADAVQGIIVTFKDSEGNPVLVSVNGGEAASTYEYTYQSGNHPTTFATAMPTAYASYQIAGKTYYSSAALTKMYDFETLAENITIIVEPRAAETTICDVNGNPLVNGATYIFRNYNVSNTYIHVNDETPTLQGTTTYNDNSYAFQVFVAGDLVGLKAIGNGKYVGATTIADGNDRVQANYDNPEDMLLFKATNPNVNGEDEVTVFSYALTAANDGVTYNLNPFGAEGRTLGFWRANSTACQWQFEPAVAIDYQDHETGAVLKTQTIKQGEVISSLFFDEEPARTISSFVLDETNRYWYADRLNFFDALATRTANTVVLVEFTNKPFTHNDINGNAIVSGNYYFLMLPGRKAAGSEYDVFLRLESSGRIRPQTSFSVSEAANNTSLFQPIGGNYNGGYNFFRLGVPSRQDNYVGTNLVALVEASNSDYVIPGSSNSSLVDANDHKVFSTAQLQQAIVFRTDPTDATNTYALNVAGGTAENKVSTWLSNIYGQNASTGEFYQMGFYNGGYNTDAGTGIQFVPALKVSFVDVNDFPVSVTINDETHSNGVIRMPYQHKLRSLVPPNRLATYWIDDENTSLTADAVIEQLATATADVTVHVNANYTLKFVDEDGNVIQADLHNGNLATGYADSHSVGMKCIFSTINLKDNDLYDYSYELKGKTYDRLGLYAALASLNVAKDEVVTVKVTGGGADLTLLDIYGNPVVAGNNYYVKFPGRGNWYLNASSSATNTSVKLQSSYSYQAPASNPILFRVEGNGNYIKLSPTIRAKQDGQDWYLASNDITVGYDRVKYSTDTEETLVFRADAYNNYTNGYALVVANTNGTGVLYFSNYSGTNYNMGFHNELDAGAYVQFIPYITGLTLNFKTANGAADQSVIVYKNTDTNQSTQQTKNAVTTVSYNVKDASTLSELQESRYFYTTSTGAGLNVVKYVYDGKDYNTWDELLSSGAAAGGDVEVWLTSGGVQPIDVNGNPVVAGKTYRLQRYQSYYLTQTSQNKFQGSADLLNDGTQYWTVTTTDDFATLQFHQGDKVVYADEQKLNSAGVAMLASDQTAVNFSAVVVDQRKHYYFFATSDVNATYALLADNGAGNNLGFRTDANGVGAKFAFVPVSVEDAYGAPLADNGIYRIEMPAKVGTASFPDGQPITLTPKGTNSTVAPTEVIPASLPNYRTYYWLPDVYTPGDYTGLKYMYNEEQVWTLEAVEDAVNTFYVKSSKHGYLKATAYRTATELFDFTADKSEASQIIAESASFNGLQYVCALYILQNNSSGVPTKYYLACQGQNSLGITTVPKSGENFYADCIFQFTPLKEITLNDAYVGGQVVAKGFDCYGPGKTSKGLTWNASTQTYDVPVTSLLEPHNMFTGEGDKNDSIVGYHLPERLFLAYNAETSAYQDVIDFATPELIGYAGTVTKTKNAEGYYEFTGYELEDYPIVASPAPKVNANGVFEFDENTNWYMIVLRQNSDKTLINNELISNVRQENLENPFVDRYLFCFVGNPVDGYLVYNKAMGAGHFMGPKYDRAMWNQAGNVQWLEDNTANAAKKLKSRIVFQMTQHDWANYYTFVDRYSGYSLDRWSDHIVYWQGRQTNSGGNTTNSNGQHNNMTDYDRTQIGQVPNAFKHGNNLMEARLMGFPSVSETYSRLLQNAMETGYLSSMIGYVGLFRTQEELDKQYEAYKATLAELYANSALTDDEYRQKTVEAYNNFFMWLKGGNTEENKGPHYPLTNGVEFQQNGYYLLRNANNNSYLAVTAGTEGANSYALTTVTDPASTPGAIWQFDNSTYQSAEYNSELGSTHQLRNVYWNARLKAMSTASGNNTASLALDAADATNIDIINDMSKMENPGQFVLRTAAGGTVNSGNVCFTLSDGTLIGASEQGGGGESRWYLVRVSTESTTSTDDWGEDQLRVEEFKTVTIPEGVNWVNGTTIGADVANTLVFTTYCNPERDVVFPHNSNIYAFRADHEVGNTGIFLEQLDDISGQTIPKNMGVVLLAENGATIDFLPVASAQVNNTHTMLVSAGSNLTANKVDAGNYAFVYKKSGSDYVLKFYKIGTAGLTMGYHRAYLPSTALEYAARGLSSLGFDMLFDDGTITKIRIPMTDVEDENDLIGGDGQGIYDIQGRRVDMPTQPGVYIINGRKVFVK